MKKSLIFIVAVSSCISHAMDEKKVGGGQAAPGYKQPTTLTEEPIILPHGAGLIYAWSQRGKGIKVETPTPPRSTWKDSGRINF